MKRSLHKIDCIPETGLITFINPYSYRRLRKGKINLNIFEKVWIDGIALVLIASILFHKKYKRRSFDMTSIVPLVFEKFQKNGSSLYVIGAFPSEIDIAIFKMKTQFPGLNIIGYRNGYFRSKSEEQIFIKGLHKLNPDIVIVGMGAMRQERFLINLWQKGWRGLGFTCGGFIRQTAVKRLDYYPLLINRLHLRWIYRIWDEPKLIWRYFALYPLGIFLFLKDGLMKDLQKVKLSEVE